MVYDHTRATPAVTHASGTGRGTRKRSRRQSGHLDWKPGLVLVLAITIFVAAMVFVSRWKERAMSTQESAAVISSTK